MAKLGFPYGSIQGVSILAMAAAVWLLATRAPFGKGVKAAWILSGMSLYHLPVIARSYALIPPLLMGIAVLYPRRHQRPLVYALALLLLSQTHAAMCAFVGGLMLLWALERLALLRKKQVGLASSLGAVGLMLAGVALLALLIPSLSSVQGAKGPGPGSPVEYFKALLYSLADAQRHVTTLYLYDKTNAGYYALLAPFLAAGGLLLLLWLWRSPKMALVYLLSLAWQGVLFTSVNWFSTQKGLLLFWQLLFCAWISINDARQEEGSRIRGRLGERLPAEAAARVFGAVLVFFALCTVPTTLTDMRYDVNPQGHYSMGKAAAEFIGRGLPPDALVIGEEEVYTASVAAYLPQGRVYDPHHGNTKNYAIYDDKPREWSRYGNLDALLVSLRGEGYTGELYYLARLSAEERVSAMANLAQADLEEVRRWFTQGIEENFILYRLQEPGA